MDGGVGAGRRAARRIRLGSNCLRCRRCWLTVARRVGDRELEGEKNGKGMDGGDPGNGNKRASNTTRDDHPLAFSRSLTLTTHYFTLTAQITMSTSGGGRGEEATVVGEDTAKRPQNEVVLNAMEGRSLSFATRSRFSMKKEALGKVLDCR